MLNRINKEGDVARMVEVLAALENLFSSIAFAMMGKNRNNRAE
jgi:hypothetical protein